MRLGLIADLHGNLFALRAVLAALDRAGVDAIHCLGDVASPGPWPAETVALLAERGIPAVLGNTDAWLLADDPARVSDTPFMNAINAWAAARLVAPARAWLAALPMLRVIESAGVSLAVFHGSPRSATEVISATTPKRPLAEMFAAVDAGLAAGGHTHVQLLRTAAERVLINPGSVGLGGTGPGTPDLPPSRPVDAAEFAVMEIVAGAVSVAFHRLPLDLPAMLAAARETGMPEVDAWAALWAG
jgi:predicted phosphodiesterase